MYSSLLAALALSIGAPAAKDAKKDPPSLVGVWVAETGTTDGDDRAVTAGSLTVEFTADGKVSVREGSKRAGPVEYRADPKRSPAGIEVTEMELVGIYKLDGDTLTLCLGRDGQRPTEFASPAGSRTMLLTLKRATPKD
jgi:uncharacterized protein (TIGR03067 family)